LRSLPERWPGIFSAPADPHRRNHGYHGPARSATALQAGIIEIERIIKESVLFIRVISVIGGFSLFRFGLPAIAILASAGCHAVYEA